MERSGYFVRSAKEAEKMGHAKLKALLDWTEKMGVLTDLKRELLAAKDGNFVGEDVVAPALTRVTEILATATATTVMSLDQAKELRYLSREVYHAGALNVALAKLDKSIEKMGNKKSKTVFPEPPACGGEAGGAGGAGSAKARAKLSEDVDKASLTAFASAKRASTKAEIESPVASPINNISPKLESCKTITSTTQEISSTNATANAFMSSRTTTEEIQDLTAQLDQVSTRASAKVTANQALLNDLKDLYRQISGPLTPQDVIDAQAEAEKQFLDEQKKISGHCTLLEAKLVENRALKEEIEQLKERVRLLEDHKKAALKKAALRRAEEANKNRARAMDGGMKDGKAEGAKNGDGKKVGTVEKKK